METARAGKVRSIGSLSAIAARVGTSLLAAFLVRRQRSSGSMPFEHALREGMQVMPQHKRITLPEVENTLDLLDASPNHGDELSRVEDLLRTLVMVDLFLVRHDRTPLARQLRRAFYKYAEGI